MCEFLERVRLTGTPTEEVRKWSGMTHRVVELTGPFPTPDEMRVELWLHEESATRLLDMCDQIDAEFHKIQAENAKLREYVTTVANDTYAMDMFDCGGCRFFEQCYNDEPKEHKGFGCQWRLWARELGIEVG